MFCKPKAGESTTHLFFGNCGPAVGQSLQIIAEALGQLGIPAVDLQVPEINQGRVYASFATHDQAAAVLEKADQLSDALGGRKIVLKFAALEADTEVSIWQWLPHLAIRTGPTCPRYLRRGSLGVHSAASGPRLSRAVHRCCSHWHQWPAAHT